MGSPLTVTAPVGSQFRIPTSDRGEIGVEVEPAAVAPSVDDSVMVNASALTNTIANATLLAALSGAAFVQEIAGANWTLTAAGCVYTYSGPARRFAVEFTMTVSASALVTVSLAIAKNADLNGVDPGALFAFGVQRPAITVINAPGAVTTTVQRIVSLQPADTVQPMGSNSGGAATTPTVRRFTMTIVPLPLVA